MPGENYETIRPRNVAILVKLETVPGTDAAPTVADAIPFEADGYSYNSPYQSEDSNEANGSLVAGAPLVVGRPAQVSIRVRLKGAGAGTTYSATVKPPHHALFQACGKRGVFTAGVAAAALTAGSINSATLGTGFAGVAASYIGMPLQLAGGTSGGRVVQVSGYTAAKVATLADLFAAALDTSVTAALLANWTYAGTTPKDTTARATDNPAATVYIYEDGTLHKFVGCKGQISDCSGQSARPGFATFQLTGIYAGNSDTAMPAVTVPQHSAPVLAMGASGVNPALVINRKELKVSTWQLNDGQALSSPDDPNTPYGFGVAEIGGRTPALVIDPLKTLKANRDPIAEIESGAIYPGVLRHGGTAGNRWSLTFPQLTPAALDYGTRDIFRKEDQTLRALNPGLDAASRDSEAVFCFY